MTIGVLFLEDNEIHENPPETDRGIRKALKFLSAIVFGLGVPDLTPIEVASVERSDDGFRRCDVGRGRYVASVTFLQKSDILEHGIGIIGLFSEIEEHVDFVVCNAGSDLLNAALTSGEELFDFKTRGLSNVFAGHFCGADIMLGEYTAISDTELYHEFSFCFGRYNCNFHERNPALPKEATRSFLIILIYGVV